MPCRRVYCPGESLLRMVVTGVVQKSKRSCSFGITSVCLFVGTCLALSVVVMIYSHEGYVQHYFKRHIMSLHGRDQGSWRYVSSDSETDDLDPDLQEDVPAAYPAFVFAPQKVETDDMDWWERQISRKDHIRKTCDRVLGNFEGNSDVNDTSPNSSPLPERLLKDMTLDPDDNILFCPSLLDIGQKASRWDVLLAQAGSEALRIQMTDHVRGISSVDPKQRERAPSSDTQKENKPQDMTWLKRFTKILFVEHPFEKIVGLYKNRIHKREGTLGYEMGRRALMYSRGLKYLSDRDLERGQLTFREMTSYVIHRDYPDPHVKSIFEVCAPCEFDYDYIVKAETFNEDLKNIFKQVFPGQKWKKMLEKFPEFQEEDDSRIEKTLFKFYKDIPEDDLLMLYDLYSIDMFMFNYQWPFEKLRVNRIRQHS